MRRNLNAGCTFTLAANHASHYLRQLNASRGFARGIAERTMMSLDRARERADGVLALAIIECASINFAARTKPKWLVFSKLARSPIVERSIVLARKVENGPEYQKSRGSSDGSGIVKVDRREHDNRGHDCPSRAV